MGPYSDPNAPFDPPTLGPASGGRRRRRRAALVFEIVGSITRSFDHVLAAALGECHHVETTPQIDPEISQSIEHIHAWLLESSSAARRIGVLTAAPAVGHASLEATVDLDATLREFITFARPLCRADGRRRGVRIRVRARFASGARVGGSGERLREVATGLLLQASDALRNGGVIDVETGDAEGGPWLEVRHAVAGAAHAATTLRVRFHRLARELPYSDPAGRVAPVPATSWSYPK